MKCIDCRFYLMPDSVCRRYPPQVIVTETVKGKATQWRSAFPPMLPGGGCGEFQGIVLEEKK